MPQAARAMRRAGMARIASWLAAAIGFGFAVLFVVQAGLFQSLVPVDVAKPPGVEDAERITSIDSVITGFDSESQPYEVTAKHGAQDKDKPNIVYLDDLGAKFRKAQGRTYTLTAKTGTYDSKAKTLDVAGDVVIGEPGRMMATMAKAHIAVEAKNLTSDVPVNVVMDNGDTISANGLKITDDGARILFLNGVKASFGGATAKGDASP